ncbi:MAG: tRNA 2-thiouridine(34) synthase MnmA, partial [Chloroflexi bacterium]|nr:tRNA 2-thiouridine(34) synthase MnmA [Chloroflexota bacterium]
CLKCNRHIRFELLLNRALAMGGDYLATGHYARVRRHPPEAGQAEQPHPPQAGSYQLLRAVDAAKDQSYVLCMLGQEQLAHALFPIGVHTKPQVRALARQFGLPVAEKVESQDLCFIPDGDHAGFLERFGGLAPNPGPIVNRAGQVLGEHRGLWRYTIGQRRGLGIAAEAPLYVLELDARRNALVVGSADELGCRELWAKEVNYVEGPPSRPLEVTAKIRYKAADVPARLYPLPAERARIVWEQPVRAAAPGQAVVFYQGEVLVGGGFIESIR